MPNPEPYRDCDECGERYHGEEAIRSYLRELECGGGVTLCIRCLKTLLDKVMPKAIEKAKRFFPGCKTCGKKAPRYFEGECAACSPLWPRHTAPST